jgi:hypothetical protein
MIFEDIISLAFGCSLKYQEFLFRVNRRFRSSFLEIQGRLRLLKLDPTDIPSLSVDYKLEVLKESIN